MDLDRFWAIVEMDEEIVKTWPQWMQDITISAESASTGRVICGHNSRNTRASSHMDSGE